MVLSNLITYDEFKAKVYFVDIAKYFLSILFQNILQQGDKITNWSC